MKKLTIFLPDLSAQQILSLVEIDTSMIDIQPINENWEKTFNRTVGLNQPELPWTQLRVAQFDIGEEVKTACTCQPVLIQMTHRGAYMLGQQPLALSANDSLRIVSQINEKLMRPGEKLLFIDKNAWVYTSEKALQLSALSVSDLIGKDLFNYPYAGNDASFWQQLGTELQMLIKQMVDYQGLAATAPETLMSVHFSDLINPQQLPELKFIKNENLTVVSNNDLIRLFCLQSMLACKPVAQLPQVNTEYCVLIAHDEEKESYPAVVQTWVKYAIEKSQVSCQLIGQDAKLTVKKPLGLLAKMKRVIMRK
ncbi:hypothetical protein [Aliikangiella maris]|uniref:PAS domain-containing protein n=2 Tax=Aliikangiella maris TaxID=3162458 RepID=A0ABV3MHS6_9GAMM